jgi:ribose/xylose/arabinose/galactoside ABC-type transport system permease subunit
MNIIKRLLKRSESYVLLIVIIFSAFITVINPAFLTLENLFDLLRSSSGTAILAIGIFLVLISGGVDVSSTTIAIVGQYISVNIMIMTGIDNILFAFAVSTLLGVILGAINAVFVSIFKLPTLIVTLVATTERSIPPVIIANIIAKAKNPNSGNCEAMEVIFLTERNLSGSKTDIIRVVITMMINIYLFFGSLNLKNDFLESFAFIVYVTPHP